MATTEKITYYGIPDVIYDAEVDITNNGTLTSTQVDKNFNTLEGRSIKSVEMSEDGTKVIVTLLNGKTYEAALSEEYATKEYVKESIKASYVFSDSSLEGNGTIKDPLKVSPMIKTGVYKPVSGVVDALPTTGMKVGDRYVIKSTLDKNGALYNYEGIKNIIENIATEFETSEYPWRVARKADWDDMLNALEPEEQDRNHQSKKEAEYLGEYAGAYIQKDEYGFNASFGGYAYEEGAETSNPHLVFNGTREGWWTASNDNYKRAFIKRVDKYTEAGDNGGVYQDIVSGDQFYSVRLVRDVKPTENYAQETIMGTEYPVVEMPSIEKGLRMWTSVNFKSDLVEGENDDLSKAKYVPSEWSAEDVFYVCQWDGTSWIKAIVNTNDCFFNVEKKEFYYLDEDGTLKPVTNTQVTELETKVSTLTATVENLNTTVTTLNTNIDSLTNRVTRLETLLNTNIAEGIVDASIKYKYDDYTMVGTFAREGNTITYTTNSSDAKDILNDFARYFGAHYYTDKVETITYNGNDYVWTPSLGLKGSNYSIDGTLNTTLMKQLTQDFKEAAAQGQSLVVNYTFNGVTITLK